MIINSEFRTSYIYILVLVVKEKNNTYYTLSCFDLKSLLTNISTCIQNISEYFDITMDIILPILVVESTEKQQRVYKRDNFVYIDFSWFLFYLFFSRISSMYMMCFDQIFHHSLPSDYSHLLPYFLLCQYIHRIIHLEHEQPVSQRP